MRRFVAESVSLIQPMMGIRGAAPLILVSCLTACAGAAPEAQGLHRTGGANKFLAESSGDPAHNLLKQSDFEDGAMLPWMYGFYGDAKGEAFVKDGALCAHLTNPGKERWDAQFRHREMIIEEGHSYVVSFKAWATRDTKMAFKVGMMGAPYTDYLARPIGIGTAPQEYKFQFKMGEPDEPTAEVAFHFGGRMVQGEGDIGVCIDDIVLSDPEFTPPPKVAAVPLPGVRVNQLGYLPAHIKVATVLTAEAAPLAWSLLDSAGKSVMSGTTQTFGRDAASGDSVQLIDFSAYATAGDGYVLQVGAAKSDPFAINVNLYNKLRDDAFKYFYHNRSGVEIKMPFASHERWARPAGHPKDDAFCAPDAGCDYTLDVTGGWYDAGDHGKYVVNGGISVWTLMNWYERTLHLGGDSSAFSDSSHLLPESGNKVPDILDEARWEMKFMLAMQVPEGKANAGMVHHKMHDDEWTDLATPPHKDTKPRHLRPVSTAATLNLAATAAQAARIWKDFDPAFSKKCSEAAQRAWQAAKKAPAKYALQSDSTGGGPYDDSNVVDEFYWAAAELYVTTGADEYRKWVVDSPLDAAMRATEGGAGSTHTAMTWQRVDALGKISMAIVPSKLSESGRDTYRAQLMKVADAYAELPLGQGYRLPLKASEKDGYPWGSNSFVINNMLVMALAYDFAPSAKYMNSLLLGMDYLLGRNAMGFSYVSGYGVRTLQNPHHRFWARQAHPDFPPPHPGALSGGPNSGLQDPYVKAAGLQGCAPQKCYVDHIEAWSANEITVNWNAPFTWVSAWLVEHAATPPVVAPVAKDAKAAKGK